MHLTIGMRKDLVAAKLKIIETGASIKECLPQYGLLDLKEI
jgi:hypothetical protein